MQRIAKALAVMLIVSVTFPGCCTFSKQARQERAHRKYVREIRREQQKEMAKAVKEANRPLREPSTMSAPVTTVTLDPQESENVAVPIVVDSSSAQPTP